MTSPPEAVQVRCPLCRHVFVDSIQRSAHLDPEPDTGLDNVSGVTCSNCGWHADVDGLQDIDGILRCSPLRELDARWRQIRADEAAGEPHLAIRVRLHRAISWLMRAEALGLPQDADGFLLFNWIGFNALYATWQSKGTAALEEWKVRRDFLEEMASRDEQGTIQGFLKEHRVLCDRLLSEEHLHAFYWADLSPEAARKARSASSRVGKSYHAKEDIEKVLLPLIDRMAMLRGQLVHGQATYGSRVNRSLVEAAGVVLSGLLLKVLELVIDHTLWQQASLWEPLPFPPQQAHFRR